MEAKDTVMNSNDAAKIYEGERERLNRHCCGCPSDYVEPVIKAQSEISFKAGIKEVVEWISSYEHIGLRLDGKPVIKDTIIILPRIWQAKLKEWGIDDN